jgi:hypothetical protein
VAMARAFLDAVQELGPIVQQPRSRRGVELIRAESARVVMAMASGR